MSELVHLNRYQDREESEAYCTGMAEYPSTLKPDEATCMTCLRKAEDALFALYNAVRRQSSRLIVQQQLPTVTSR